MAGVYPPEGLEPVTAPESVQLAEEAPRQELAIAGFWRRISADLLDILIVSVVFWILGTVSPEFFYAAGPYGRVFTYGLAVAYFTIAGSYIGKGQTLGKRLLGTAVTDAEGCFLGFKRAFVRSSILLLIPLWNSWDLPLLVKSPVFIVLQVMIVFGGILTLAYGYVINRSARQGPHDLVVNSLVVRIKRYKHRELSHSTLDGPGTQAVVAIPARKPLHTRVVLAIYAALLLASPILFVTSADRELLQLSEALTKDTPFFVVSASRTDDVLELYAWYDEDCAADLSGRYASQACNELVAGMAPIIEEHYDQLGEIAWLRVVVFRRRDTGAFFTIRSQTRSAGQHLWSIGFGGWDSGMAREDEFMWYAPVNQ